MYKFSKLTGSFWLSTRCNCMMNDLADLPHKYWLIVSLIHLAELLQMCIIDVEADWEWPEAKRRNAKCSEHPAIARMPNRLEVRVRINAARPSGRSPRSAFRRSAHTRPGDLLYMHCSVINLLLLLYTNERYLSVYHRQFYQHHLGSRATKNLLRD